jgi:hypothetical protein
MKGRRMLTCGVLAVGLLVHCGTPSAADLCVDGLCVVRAQVPATSGLMTRYHPLLLTLENRTGEVRSIASLSTAAAESVRVLSGDEWDPPRPERIRLAGHEYKAFDARTELRVMMVGVRQPLRVNDVITLVITVGTRSLTIPVTVIRA